jgi:hypothetical protein
MKLMRAEKNRDKNKCEKEEGKRKGNKNIKRR